MRTTLAVALLWLASIAQAQTINLSVATQKTSAQMIVPTLTWSTTPSGATCTAWGGWSGTKAASGTESRPALSGTRAYNLRCRWPASTGAVDLAWEAPTENVDGSAYANPSGYEILYGTPPSLLTGRIPVASFTITEQRIEELKPASWGFCVSALNALNVASHCSEVITQTVTASAVPIERSVGVSVNSLPSGAPP
jgi:hypothetical protein